MHKISVIIPVYNVDDYLSQCIESITRQTYKNLEIILINDGSTDKSKSICEKYAELDERIKVINKENGGLSSARNAGLDICTGDYIGFVDGDDYIDDDMYEILYKNIIENNAEISMCRSRRIPQKGRDYEFKETACKIIDDKKLMIEELFLSRQTAIAVCLKLYKRKLFAHLRFPLNKTTEDGAIVLNLIGDCRRMVVQNISKYNYRRTENSITKQKRFSMKILDIVEVYQENAKKIRNEYKELNSVADYRLYWAYREALARIAVTMDYQEHKDIIRKLQYWLRKNIRQILSNRHMTYKQKIATVIAMSSCRVYGVLKQRYGAD